MIFSSRPVPALLVALLSSLVVTIWFFEPLKNYDLWWHLDSGRWMLAHQQLLLVEQRSFTEAGASWNNLAWPFQLMLGIIWHLGGEQGLVWMKAALWVLLGTLLLHFLHRLAGHWGLALLSAVPFALTGIPYLHLRPHLLEAFWLLGLLWLLQRRLTLARYLLLWLLLVVWANTHGSAIVGLVAAGVQLLWLAYSDPLRRRAYLFGCVMLVFPLWLTPVGLGLVEVLLGHGGERAIGAYLVEWLAPAFFPKEFYLAALVAMLGILLRPPQLLPTILFMLAFFVFMSFGSRRFLFESGLLLSVATAYALGQIAVRLDCDAWRKHLFSGAAAALLLVLYGWAFKAVAFRWADPLHPGVQYPHYTASLLKQAAMKTEEPVRVFNTYQFGGFLSWSLGERAKVFIDGRTPTVFPESLLYRYNAMLRDARVLQTLAGQYGIRALLTERGKFDLSALINGNCEHWWLVGFDDVSALYLRPELARQAGFECLGFNPNRLRTTGDYSTAQLEQQVAKLERLVTRRGSSAALAYQAGHRLLALDEKRRALSWLRRAVEMAPWEVKYRLALAELLADEPNLNQQEVWGLIKGFFRWVRPLPRKDQEVRLASLLLTVQRPDLALQVLDSGPPQKRSELDASCLVWSMRALANSALENREEALEAQQFASLLCAEAEHQPLLESIDRAMSGS